MEKYLKKQVPVFWRKNAHNLGYQEPVQVTPGPRTSSSEALMTPASLTATTMTPMEEMTDLTKKLNKDGKRLLETQESIPTTTIDIINLENIRYDLNVVHEDYMKNIKSMVIFCFNCILIILNFRYKICKKKFKTFVIRIGFLKPSKKNLAKYLERP